MERQTIKVDIIVKKLVSEVFAYISDLNNCANPSVKVEEVIVDEPIAVGTKFKIIGSLGEGERNWKSKNKIINMEKDKSFGYIKLGYEPLLDVTYIFEFAKSFRGTRISQTTKTITSHIDLTTKDLKEELEEIKKKIEK